MDLTGKKVAVYGLGVSGLSALAYLQDIELSSLLVVDGREVSEWSDEAKEILDFLKNKKKATVEVLTRQQNEGDVADLFSQQDLIILSPGIARESAVLKEALKNKVEVLNEIEVGYRLLEDMDSTQAPKVLALTGTNGKTTCVTFLGEVLKEAKLNTFVGGNIGTPLLRSLRGHKKSPFDIYLFEVSSFQCESLGHFRPQVGGILNLAANHGERYDSVEGYRQAKWLLAKSQHKDDRFLIGPDVGQADFAVKSQVIDVAKTCEDELKKNFDLKELKLVGQHNRWNLGFCWLFLSHAIETMNLDREKIKSAFQKVLNRFTGVEHRLEYVGQAMGLEVYNDAKSTNWLATLTAIEAVKERGLPITLILGGQLRGHNDEPSQEIKDKLSGITILTIGESGAFLKEKGHDFNYCKDLDGVLDFCRENESSGLLLFSPAFPSFDQFRNYAERGRVFKEKVSDLG